MGFLEEIVRLTRMRVEAESSKARAGDLRGEVIKANSEGRLGVIAEYKRMSPTGAVNFGVDPWSYFNSLRDKVVGFSVLTEPLFFAGNYLFVKIAAATGRPVLFKDFVVDRRQVDAAGELGASAVLIIYKALGPAERGDLVDYAGKKGLQVLLEVDNAADALAAVDEFPNALLGVNSRNLDDLSVSLSGVVDAIKQVRGRADVVIAESGVSSRGDAERLASAGANAVLVGTALMRDPSLAGELGVRIHG